MMQHACVYWKNYYFNLLHSCINLDSIFMYFDNFPSIRNCAINI